MNKKIFEQMEKELAEYNKALGEGKTPKAPEYDIELFRAFRKWQQERIAAQPFIRRKDG